MGSERDWTKLPSDLLGLIAERLSVVDYIRFSTVSTSLASALGRGRLCRPKGGPQCCPWLLLPGDNGLYSETCSFFSISDNKSYKIESLPEIYGMMWKGSTQGWVVIQNRTQLRLLNPLTGAQFQLPSIVPSTDVSLIQGEFYIASTNESLPRNQFFRAYVRKVVLSSSPSTTTTSTGTATVHCSYTAVAIIGAFNYLAFTKAGDEKWTIYMEIRHVEDVIYHKGNFYCLDFHSRIWALDLTGPSPKKKIISEMYELPDDDDDDDDDGGGGGGDDGGGGGDDDDGDDSETLSTFGHCMKYLVESSGNLLQVWRDIEYQVTSNDMITEYYTVSASVFKFDLNEAKWIPLSNLDDRCLFLGNSDSISLSARDIPGLMHNCIHFTDNYWDGHYIKSSTRDVGVFNIEDGSFKPYHSCDSRIKCPPPIWFIPNLF